MHRTGILMTRFGPLDVLSVIGRSHGYDDLLPHTNELEVGEGLRVRVLDLETLIAVKEEVMRQTLDEKRRRGGS